MLQHAHTTPQKPARVVVLGAHGVLGKPLVDLLDASGVETLALGSRDINLEAEGAGEALAGHLKEGDAIVFLAALTPDRGRDIATMMRNFKMAENVCTALAARPVANVIYMSSDAVYPMGPDIVTEATAAAPRDLYGAMHMTREVMMAATVPVDRLAIVRCTMVLSANDTHNSYGPNRFRVQGKYGKITLGGEGEETRDHILDNDVARLIYALLERGSHGILNAATGESQSFRTVAETVAANIDPKPELAFTPRNNTITHRHFDITATRRTLPDFRFTPLDEAIAIVHRAIA